VENGWQDQEESSEGLQNARLQAGEGQAHVLAVQTQGEILLIDRAYTPTVSEDAYNTSERGSIDEGWWGEYSDGDYYY
jgi:streptomycin 6-kinase